MRAGLPLVLAGSLVLAAPCVLGVGMLWGTNPVLAAGCLVAAWSAGFCWGRLVARGRLRLGPVLFYSHHLGDYVSRWIVQHPWGTVRLHHLRRSDADPELHDHPWDFWSLLVWGTYDEELDAGQHRRGRGDSPTYLGPDRAARFRRPRRWLSLLYRGAEEQHRVLLPEGRTAWTLVFSGPKRRSWGFWRGASFIPWRDFVSAKEFTVEEYAAGLPDRGDQ